jgi:glycosyltransferase involved in cell wall biosynthesis
MSNTKLIPLNQGVDVEKFYAPTKEEVRQLKNGKFIFLFVGKVAKRKGVEFLIKAFNKLAPEAPEAELWLVGAGAPETVALFKSMIKTERIKILGRILTDEIPKYYQACDVFVLPSLDEAASNAVAEAFVCGKPVITTKIGQVLDYFKDSEFGYLVAPADSEGLYQALKKIYQNQDLREKMAENTKRHGLENYAMDKVAETVIKGFENLKKI